ncbi:1-acyl-sn-glycerol-3-phosphate acyltransferase [candidate division KSB1 bacterium]|nr:1-acyl-sn-glycerol-3-phosphate acyltransferase [candidate division KSB1 bacterium]MBL7093055.1 1-acyl-sn-glycerol-3-phosphate acyltransferase [candidate division KSB1 bacterium]
MKYIISIYILFVAGLVFGTILLVTLIFTFILPAKVYDPWVKKMLRFFFKAIFTKVEVEGIENINPKATYLFMSNHVSMFDIPLLGGFIPNFFRGIEADYQHEWPFYGWVMKRYGNITIPRENIHQSISSVRKAEKIMQKGKSIAILPEGHRTLDGKLRNFKKLPFFLAKQAGVDLVPIGLSGLFQLKRKGSWIVTPTPLKVKFGTPISATQIEKLSVKELRDLTREKIQGLIERP